MTKLLTVLILLMVTTPVMAQENLPAACKLIPESHNVVYQPGVDVDGNAVVPADLNASPMGDVLNIIRVPLEFDLAQRISGLNIEGVEMTSSLGMLEIHQNGKVMYNDQDITKPVMTLCAKSHKEVTVEVVDVPVSAPEPVAAAAPAASIAAPEIPQAPEAIEIPHKAPVAPIEPAVESVATIDVDTVTVPKVEFLDELTPTKERMANMKREKISQPASPKQALVGIPRKTPTLDTSDVIKGQDYRNYNE